jgi:peptidase E
MKVLIGGSRNWVDYNHIVRRMTILLEDWVRNNPEDKRIIFVHSASTPAENMVTEYIGKVDKLLKQKGYHIDE